jgi:RNA methyltransferase, TrmH family
VLSITKQQIQFLRSLRERKVREEQSRFIVEGIKLVQELCDEHEELIEAIFCEEPKRFNSQGIKVIGVNAKELAKISSQKTPNKVVALVKKPVPEVNDNNPLILALDGIQDPGNLGTIIRTAEWFGVDQIVCSKDTVDCYNPKVVQSTMGSLFRVKIIYTDLFNWLKKTKRVKYAAALTSGSNAIYRMESNAVLIIGNEGNGISPEIRSICDDIVTIPKYGNAESLNAAIATGILLAEYKKQQKVI